ncbi:MAG TPA: hypothetical protein VGB34_03140 [Candidatus Limnocylindria bacterium]|jgi:hypothetical protein
MQIRRLVTTAAIVAGLAMPAPAVADCQPAGPLAQEIARAPIAFVGTVVDTGVDGAPPAAFLVEEVWVGQLPAESVRVRGLAVDETFGEDDRRWRRGARYLVAPIVDGNVLRDSICSATTEWRPELAALRPIRVPSAARGIAVPLLPILAVAAFVVVLLTAFVGCDRVAPRVEGKGPE